MPARGAYDICFGREATCIIIQYSTLYSRRTSSASQPSHVALPYPLVTSTTSSFKPLTIFTVCKRELMPFANNPDAVTTHACRLGGRNGYWWRSERLKSAQRRHQISRGGIEKVGYSEDIIVERLRLINAVQSAAV